jgi:TctA family transporter
MILGFILGPMFELNLRKMSQLFMMNPLSFANVP